MLMKFQENEEIPERTLKKNNDISGYFFKLHTEFSFRIHFDVLD